MLGIMTASLMPIPASFATLTRILWAGQNIPVGTLDVEIIDDDLVVTFTTLGGWTLTETHLYVGTSQPTKSAPGKFPYKQDHPGGVTSYTYIIPLEDIGNGPRLYLAAHAVVENLYKDLEETAWAKGCKIPKGKNGNGRNGKNGKGNWAIYFFFDIPLPS